MVKYTELQLVHCNIFLINSSSVSFIVWRIPSFQSWHTWCKENSDTSTFQQMLFLQLPTVLAKVIYISRSVQILK